MLVDENEDDDGGDDDAEGDGTAATPTAVGFVSLLLVLPFWRAVMVASVEFCSTYSGRWVN